MNLLSLNSHKHRRCGDRHGVALVLTLLIISMLVVVVVGFTSVSRLEQIAARNYTYQTSAQQMAQMATGSAMEKLAEAFAQSAGTVIASQPGRISLLGGSNYVLSSAGSGSVNINSLSSATNGDGWITGSGDQLSVGWQTISNASGQPIGRIAYFVDDESTKLPVNQASPGRTSWNPRLPRPFSIRGVDTNLQPGAIASFSNVLTAAANNSRSISNWSFFFTQEQLAAVVTNIGPVRSQRVTVAQSTNPVSANTTPWGTPKVNLNALAPVDASVPTLAAALSDSRMASVFGGTFATKYTPAGLNQIAANLLQLRTDHWRGGPSFEGIDPVLGTALIPGGVLAPPVGPLKKTNGIPQEFFGYVPFPMLAEIDASYVFGWQNPPPDDSMTIRVIVTCVLTNPFPIPYEGGGQLYAQIDKASFLLFYANNPGLPPAPRWRGPDGSIRSSAAPHNDLAFDNPWGSGPQVAAWNLLPPNGVQLAPIPSIGAGQSESVSVSYDMSFVETNPTTQLQASYIIIDSIKLLAQGGQVQSIRDWCSGNDFFNALAQSAQGPAQIAVNNIAQDAPALIMPSSPFAARGALPNLALPPPRKLVRLDPRMRSGLELSAIYQPSPPGRLWSEVSFASAPPAPQDFATEMIPSDPIDAARAIYDTNLPPVLPGANGTYSTAADLGKVFTGMPWRTLRIQPQPALEAAAQMIPDWALLDIVSLSPTNAPVTPVNPNIRFSTAGTAPTGFGSGMRSLLDVLTNGSLVNVLADNTTGLLGTNALPTGAGVTTTATGIGALLSNASRPEALNSWTTNNASSWRTRRAKLGFPSEVLVVPSELAEVAGFADFVSATGTNSFKLNEHRLSALFPGVSTRSSFYTIYAVGEVFEGTNQQVAASSLLKTLVEIDNSTTPPSVRTVLQQPASN